MDKIWVVEIQCNEGNWWAATDDGRVLAYNNFYSAHRVRRIHYRYLKSVAKKIWSWKRIRVRQWNAPAKHNRQAQPTTRKGTPKKNTKVVNK